MDIFSAGISFVALTILELVLSIDNVLFISLVSGAVDPRYQSRVRKIGITIATIARIALLLGINWLMHLNDPLFNIGSFIVSVKDIIVVLGGIYLIYYSNLKIFEEINKNKPKIKPRPKTSYLQAIVTISIVDSVFSLDSILTAVSIGYNIYIMIAAILVSLLALLISINSINSVIVKYPSIKLLALAFLILVGLNLLVEGIHFHFPKVYIFVIIAFSAFVQFITIKLYQKRCNL